MSLALARKYRPSTFDDLIGQESVSQTLVQALESSRLSHAYLFSGLRGSGKTSTARIFARALLCEQGESAHPCGKCPSCIAANEGRHIDIIEMDAASNRGIDDIKEIIEHTKYKPGMARYKIFIIDEVHMLTPQAFNALLKTLEEPPAFVKFILATTDPLKLPATILSRSQHFRFKKISHKLVLQHLEHILNKEGIEYEHSALEVIARSGAGSLRDSLTLLDQAIVYSKNFVDSVTVTRMLGIIEVSLLENLVKNILARNESEILAFVKDSAEYETEMIINELILHLKERLLSQDPLIQPMILDRFFRILSDAKSLLALNADGEFILLLTLLKMVEALQIKEIDSMIKTLEKELNGSLLASPTMISSPNISKTNQTIVLSMEEIGIEATPQHKHEVKSSTQNETQTKHIEITNQNEPNSQPDPLDHRKQKQTFDLLIKKIYDRDYELGECFEKNIHFVKFENSTLTWETEAQEEDKKILTPHFGMIRMFIRDLFGIETKIVPIAINPSQKTTENAIETTGKEQEEKECAPESGSMIEEYEMRSSCIMPESGDEEAAKEKEPSNILEEPMIVGVLNLFDPQKVRVKKKS